MDFLTQSKVINISFTSLVIVNSYRVLFCQHLSFVDGLAYLIGSYSESMGMLKFPYIFWHVSRVSDIFSSLITYIFQMLDPVSLYFKKDLFLKRPIECRYSKCSKHQGLGYVDTF